MQHTPEIENIILNAIEDAKTRSHQYVTVEHLLFALLTHPPFKKCIEGYGADAGLLIDEVDAYLEGLHSITKLQPDDKTKKTVALDRTINRCVSQVMFSNRKMITTADLYFSISCETNSHASYFLLKYGISREAFIKYWNTNYKGTDHPHKMMDKEATQVLEEYTINLTDLARQKKLEPIIGRSKEIGDIINVLAKKFKSNVLLVGDPGVGKTAIIEGIANKIIEGEIPEFLEGYEVFSLEIGSLLAGCRYRGDFEEKVKVVLDALASKKKAILFIDEAHTMQGAGSSTSGSIDFANMIKPAITKGDLKVIASTTWEEFYESFEKDRALMRRFYRISVDEPSNDSTIRILSGLSARLNDFHEVVITDEAISAAVECSARYIHDRKNPDKSIDLIDAACALQKVSGNKNIEITKDMIFAQVEKYTGVPADKLSGDNYDRVLSLDVNIKNKLYGQDEVVDTVLEKVYTSFAGISNDTKPIASFLFLGPTGTGKTETAKLLSKNLDMPLLKYDMSEYAEKHSVSSLIGPPPGYVGFNDSQVQGGRLISDLSKNPHAILLFDEVEKAHPDIFNIFLQMLDEGTITGSSGKQVSCKNTIIIMTSNLGSADSERNTIGFGPQERTGDDDKALKAFFKPEFRNRIDAVCKFNKLDTLSIKKIVVKFTEDLKAKLVDKHNISLNLAEPVINYLAEKGYDPKMGARPLARKIDELIRVPLSKKILFDRLKDTNILASLVDDKIEFIVTPKALVGIDKDGIIQVENQ